MTKIGGWWLATESLASDETVISRYPTNYFHGSRRPYGGRLYLTDRRLIFLPHFIDSFFGARRTSIDFSEINRIEAETAESNQHGPHGSMPPRLEITTNEAIPHQFVVKNVQTVADDIRSAHQTSKDRLDLAPQNKP